MSAKGPASDLGGDTEVPHTHDADDALDAHARDHRVLTCDMTGLAADTISQLLPRTLRIWAWIAGKPTDPPESRPSEASSANHETMLRPTQRALRQNARNIIAKLLPAGRGVGQNMERSKNDRNMLAEGFRQIRPRGAKV